MGNDVSRGNVLIVDRTTVKVQRKLGEGGFANIFIATEISSGASVVLKRMRVSAEDTDGVKLARNEIRVLESLPPHPNIIGFIAAAEHAVSPPGSHERYVDFDIVMEYCSAGSLHDEVMGFWRRGERMPEARLLRRFRDSASAISHLHSQQPPVCHRDIKPENFLLSNVGSLNDGSFSVSASSVSGMDDPKGARFVVRLADFGSCVIGSTALGSEVAIGLEEALLGTYTPKVSLCIVT